jgi:hypothetical protein
MELSMRALAPEELRSEYFLAYSGLHDPTYFLRELMDEQVVVGLENSGLGRGITCATVFPNSLSVAIASGAPYFFGPELGATPTPVSLGPVRQIAVLPGSSGAVLADFQRACLVDDRGIVWISETLSYDGIRNLRIAGDRVLAEGFNAPLGDETSSIILDLRSGKALRSAYP